MAKQRRIYSADVVINGTIYAIAKNKKDAVALMAKFLGTEIEAKGGSFNGDPFTDPELPTVHFSPAMTVEPKQKLKVSLNETVEVETVDDEEHGEIATDGTPDGKRYLVGVDYNDDDGNISSTSIVVRAKDEEAAFNVAADIVKKRPYVVKIQGGTSEELLDKVSEDAAA